ncbi:MAG: hypothetical protein KL787_04205 [Taibaiella sp.]|nr:hypothetical protein [Taibaiella sp.]
MQCRWVHWVHGTDLSPGDILIPFPGYLLVFVNTGSPGRDVWFDDLHVGHYYGQVLEENHYYPFGLTLTETGAGAKQNPYKYQGIELERHFGLETYETFYRGLDPQLGRFNSIDPKAEKHYSVTPYSSMDNNPVINIDPLGDDWFVNSTNGDVIFVRGYSKIDQNTLDKFNYGGHDVNEYERFGPDNMFGDKVIVNNYGDDVLKADFVVIEDPVNFMKSRGYGSAEKSKN